MSVVMQELLQLLDVVAQTPFMARRADLRAAERAHSLGAGAHARGLQGALAGQRRIRNQFDAPAALLSLAPTRREPS